MSDVYFLGSDEMFEPITISSYSDDTPLIKTGGFNRIADRARVMVVRHTNLNDFVAAMFLYDELIDAGARNMKLVLPYVPGARQDRSNPTGDVLFTAKSVAKMINQRLFSRVLVLDPHSPVTTNLIDRVIEFPLTKVAEKIPNTYYGVVAADKGGRDRAFEFYCGLLSPPRKFVTANKTRDVSTGKLTGFEVEVEAGKHYLVADDICDGGGTFMGLGEKIREQGATADLYVTHGIFSKGVSSLMNIYDNIYTTDSLPRDKDFVQVIPVVKEMENYS